MLKDLMSGSDGETESPMKENVGGGEAAKAPSSPPDKAPVHDDGDEEGSSGDERTFPPPSEPWYIEFVVFVVGVGENAWTLSPIKLNRCSFVFSFPIQIQILRKDSSYLLIVSLRLVASKVIAIVSS